jgi:putative intracellular protease/amidase
MKAKLLFPVTVALLVLLAANYCVAQQQHPRVLILVTSADKFPDGRPTGLWLEEYAIPYDTFAKAGFEMTVVSPKGGETPVDPRSKGTAEQENAWANAIKALHTATRLSSSIRANDFDAIFIPGGHGPLFDLAIDPQSVKLISEFARSGKPVASVCHGPAALIGVTLTNGEPFVKGKKVTSFSDSEEVAADSQHTVPFSVQQKLTALGGHYSQGANFTEYTVADGNLITGQNPSSSGKVAQLLLEAIKARN